MLDGEVCVMGVWVWVMGEVGLVGKCFAFP